MTSAVAPKVIEAVQQIRRMRGGSQAHLMRASDGFFYIVKFQNNPQHVRVLANEFFASRLGRWLGLPVPDVTPIEVSEWLIAHTPDLHVETAGYQAQCSAGLQLASRFVADPHQDLVFDYLPESLMIEKTHGIADFPRCLAFDKWTGNADGRQAVFSKKPRTTHYNVTFIDQGYCFNCSEWTFPDLALQGVFFRNFVYQHVTGWHDFEPTLSRIEQMEYNDIRAMAQGMPEEWYQSDSKALSRLIYKLYERRSMVRGLITAFRNSCRNPFPNWAGN